MISETLYKRDNSGKIRRWHAEIKEEDGRVWTRTVSALLMGQENVSSWKEIFSKNVGRSNETSALDQAKSEIESMITLRKRKGYTEDLDAVDEALAETFKPMLADKYEKRTPDFKIKTYSQPKLDGMRCIARADGLWSRTGKKIETVPHVWKALETFFDRHPLAVIDGELYNHDLRDDFNSLMSMLRKGKPTDRDLLQTSKMVQYHVYDAMFENSPELHFTDRFHIMQQQICAIHTVMHQTPIRFVQTELVSDQETLDEIYADYLQNGFEGQMIRLDAPYENKRSKYLIKRKEFQDEEFPVIAVEEGEGNWAGAVKRFVVDLGNGQIAGAAPVATMEQMRELWNSGKKPDWAKVRYQNRTPDGSLRFPNVLDYGFGERTD